MKNCLGIHFFGRLQKDLSKYEVFMATSLDFGTRLIGSSTTFDTKIFNTGEEGTFFIISEQSWCFQYIQVIIVQIINDKLFKRANMY